MESQDNSFEKTKEEDAPSTTKAKDFDRNKQLERWFRIGIIVLAAAVTIIAALFIYRYFLERSSPPRTFEDYRLRAARELVAKEPKNPIAYTVLGNIYRDRKEYNRAIKQYKVALGYDSKLAPALYGLGSIYYDLGKLEEALRYLKKAARYSKAGARYLTYFRLGEIYEKKKNNKRAMEYYQKSVKDNPTMWNPYYKLGQFYEKQGKKDLALENYQKATQFNPANKKLEEAIKRLSEKK